MSRDSIAAFARDVAQREGRIHGLVNNAAIATNVGGKLFDEIDLDLWDRVMRVNVRGAPGWSRARWRRSLPKAGRGGSSQSPRYRALGSAAASRLRGEQGRRYFDDALARSRFWSARHRRHGGRARHHACEATEYVPAERHQLYETQRAVSGPQEPEDIVDTVVFLLTPGALALTGQVLPVDAGFVFT